LSSQLRNLLIPGVDNRIDKQDLFSLNVQRARDHCITDYNSVRVAYGLAPLKYICEMSDNVKKIIDAQYVYPSFDHFDAWVGVLLEKSLEGAELGELGSTAVG
jgi:peroxidase